MKTEWAGITDAPCRHKSKQTLIEGVVIIEEEEEDS